MVGWWFVAGAGVALVLVILAAVAFRIVARQDERRVQLLRQHWRELGHVVGDDQGDDQGDEHGQGDDEGRQA